MANIGDTVRVRFDLSKIGGMDAFQKKLRIVNRPESVEKYPIGHAVGVVIGKGYTYPAPDRRESFAIVQFSAGQVVCGLYDVSRASIAVSMEDGPDFYGKRIVNDKTI